MGASGLLSLKFPSARMPWREGRARTARNFRPSRREGEGGTRRRGRAPQPLVIPRLKASFNIYDLFRFNSTRKREAYLYSADWPARSLARCRSGLLDPSRQIRGLSEFQGLDEENVPRILFRVRISELSRPFVSPLICGAHTLAQAYVAADTAHGLVNVILCDHDDSVCISTASRFESFFFRIQSGLVFRDRG